MKRGSGGVAELGGLRGDPARREDTQRAVGLLRVNPGGQVMRLGAGLQQPQGFRVDAGVPHVQFQVEVVLQGVGAFHHNIEGLDAVDGDVALGENLGLRVVEIYTDQNAELFGQDNHAFLAWLRHCSRGGRDAAANGRASAASFSVGNECDLRNTRFHCVGATTSTLDIQRPGSTVNLGSVNAKGNFAKNRKTVTLNATMTAATVTVGGVPRTVVAVTLGSVASGGPSLRTSSTAVAMVWSPTSSVTGGAGVASSTAPATETGTLDRDF
jgi:hypothetical protein